MKYLNSAQRLSKDMNELTLVLIDFSPSMNEDDYRPSRKKGAIKANTKLIETKAGLYPQDRLGIIAFDDRAHLIHAPVEIGQNTKSLCRSLQKKITYNGGTNFTAALKLAQKRMFNGKAKAKSSGVISKFFSELLFESPQPDSKHLSEVNSRRITRRIILLTDGEHNGQESPMETANQLKSSNVIIECIGIAGKRNDVDEKMLKAIASRDENNQPRYCFIKDTSSLIRKYESLAHHIRPA